VTQESALFSSSVCENILMGLREQDRPSEEEMRHILMALSPEIKTNDGSMLGDERSAAHEDMHRQGQSEIIHMLKQASRDSNAAEYIHTMQEGFATRVGERGGQISSG